MENKQELFNEFLAANFGLCVGLTAKFVKYTIIFSNGEIIFFEIFNDRALEVHGEGP
jgi:hypothetical protein